MSDKSQLVATKWRKLVHNYNSNAQACAVREDIGNNPHEPLQRPVTNYCLYMRTLRCEDGRVSEIRKAINALYSPPQSFG